MGTMLIRPALPADGPAIWALIGPVLAAGETYALDPDISRADALAYWLGPDRKTFVAEDAGKVVGTYYLRPNQAGGGNHVCNCGYISAAPGVGRKMAEDYGRLMRRFFHPVTSFIAAEKDNPAMAEMMSLNSE